jgi:hypothetical protein
LRDIPSLAGLQEEKLELVWFFMYNTSHIYIYPSKLNWPTCMLDYLVKLISFDIYFSAACITPTDTNANETSKVCQLCRWNC